MGSSTLHKSRVSASYACVSFGVACVQIQAIGNGAQEQMRLVRFLFLFTLVSVTADFSWGAMISYKSLHSKYTGKRRSPSARRTTVPDVLYRCFPGFCTIFGVK